MVRCPPNGLDTMPLSGALRYGEPIHQIQLEPLLCGPGFVKALSKALKKVGLEGTFQKGIFFTFVPQLCTVSVPVEVEVCVISTLGLLYPR